MQKLNADQKTCTGCRACEQICPVNAIRMIEDDEGFLIPDIDHAKCIDCGKCVKHCHMCINTDCTSSIGTQKVYAAIAKDDDIVEHSSSGGMFSIFAQYFIKNHGAVFGCAFDSSYIARHISVERMDDLELLRGSKYVASDLMDSYSQVKDKLEQGRLVLFTGCPCHIAGLNAFLGKAYTNLYTIDIVCHGTPSQKIFNKYLGWLTHRKNGNIEYFSFRCKDKGWNLTMHSRVNGKSIFTKYFSDPYYSAFHRNIIHRESCYSCRYAKEGRIGDLTIGDYWGIETAHPNFINKKGVSVLTVNSDKGTHLFNSVSETLNYIPSSMEQASKYNGNLVHPTERPLERNVSYQSIDNYSDMDFVKSNLKIPAAYRIKGCLKASIPFSVKVKLKQFLKLIKG